MKSCRRVVGFAHCIEVFCIFKCTRNRCLKAFNISKGKIVYNIDVGKGHVCAKWQFTKHSMLLVLLHYDGQKTLLDLK